MQASGKRQKRQARKDRSQAGKTTAEALPLPPREVEANPQNGSVNQHQHQNQRQRQQGSRPQHRRVPPHSQDRHRDTSPVESAAELRRGLLDRCLANGRTSLTELVEPLLPLIVQSGANWFFNVVPKGSCQPTLAALQLALFDDPRLREGTDAATTLPDDPMEANTPKLELPKRLKLDSSETHAVSCLASSAFPSVTVPLRGELRDVWMKLELSERRQFCIIAARALARLAAAIEASSAPMSSEQLAQAVLERILRNELLDFGFADEDLEVELLRYLAGVSHRPAATATNAPEEQALRPVPAAEGEPMPILPASATPDCTDTHAELDQPNQDGLGPLPEPQGPANDDVQCSNVNAEPVDPEREEATVPAVQEKEGKKKKKQKKQQQNGPEVQAIIRSPNADEFIRLCTILRHVILSVCQSHPNGKSTKPLSSLLESSYRSLLSGLTKAPGVREFIVAAKRAGATPPESNDGFLRWIHEQAGTSSDGPQALSLPEPQLAMLRDIYRMPLTQTLLQLRHFLSFCDDVFLSFATQSGMAAALAEAMEKRKAAGVSMEEQVGKSSKKKHKSHADRILKVNADLADEVRQQLEAAKCQPDRSESEEETEEEEEGEVELSQEEQSQGDDEVQGDDDAESGHSLSEPAASAEAPAGKRPKKEKKKKSKEGKEAPAVTASDVSACVSAIATRILPTVLAIARLCEAINEKSAGGQAQDQDTALVDRVTQSLTVALDGATTLRWPQLPDCSSYRPSAEDRAALIYLSEAFRDPARSAVVATSGRKFVEACCLLKDDVIRFSSSMPFATTKKIVDALVAKYLAAVRRGGAISGTSQGASLQRLVEVLSTVRSELPSEVVPFLPEEGGPSSVAEEGLATKKKAKKAKKQESQRLETRDTQLVIWALGPKSAGLFINQKQSKAERENPSTSTNDESLAKLHETPPATCTEDSPLTSLQEIVGAIRTHRAAKQLDAALFLQRGGGIDLLMPHGAGVDQPEELADDEVLEDDVLGKVFGSDILVSYDADETSSLRRVGVLGLNQTDGLDPQVMEPAVCSKLNDVTATISRLPLHYWAARCAKMRFSSGERELVAELLHRPVEVDADPELWRFFCRNVAMRPFYAIGRGVQLDFVDVGQGELDVAVFDVSKPDLNILLAAVEVKRHAADVVKAQHQRVRLEEKVAVAMNHRHGARCILKCTSQGSNAALASRSYNGLVRDVFPLFHRQPVPRWFVAIAVENSRGTTKELNLGVLPSKARHQFVAQIASTLTNSPYLVRPLRADLRFHPDYLNWLGATEGSSKKKKTKTKSGGKIAGLKDWFNVAPLMEKHASQLCSQLARSQNKRCVGKEARSPLEVVSEMLDAGVLSSNLILVDLFAIKKEEQKAKRKNRK